jgi:hypothetical protein
LIVQGLDSPGNFSSRINTLILIPLVALDENALHMKVLSTLAVGFNDYFRLIETQIFA